jgi:hypothetical protein
VTGVNELGRSADRALNGHIVGGAIGLAMALPVGPGKPAGAGKVVIGETMERVVSYAKKAGGDWYKARGTNAANWIRNNLQWLNRQIRRGKEVVDIGTDPNRALRSENYAAEKRLLERRDYPSTSDPQP